MGTCLAKLETNAAIVPYSSPQKKSSSAWPKSILESGTQQNELKEVRLYGAEFCPFTARIRILLMFKGVPAQVLWLDAVDDKARSKQLQLYMLPDGKLPILQYGDQIISGTPDDILDHIEAQFPKPSVAAHAKSVMEWVSYVRDTFSPLMLQALFKVDPLCQQNLQAAIHEAYDRLDHAIAKHGSKGPYFMGDQFSLVDVYLIPFLLLAKPLSYFQGIHICPSHAHLINYSNRVMSFSCYAPITMDTDLLQKHVGRRLALNVPLPLVTLTVLQHHSMLNHFEKLVQMVDELLQHVTQTTRRVVDPEKGSVVMQIRRVAARYGSLLDFMLEHAQMEERVIFPALEKADRGITKTANESHASDLPVMNGIKEDLKSVLALDQESPGKSEALQTVLTRLRALQEHARKHFLEEEAELLPLLSAAGLGSKQQTALMGKCVSIMESLHMEHFAVFLDGLLPHEIHQYVELLYKFFSKDSKDHPFSRMISALKLTDDYQHIWCIVCERLPAVAMLA